MQSQMTYIVYKHTSPSGKVYIGITKHKNPEKRWGKNGGGYVGSYFYHAIEKYGWDNIKHEILFSELSKEEACKKEIDLISHYKSLNISYNIADGGDGVHGLDEETRKRMGHDQHGEKNTFYKHKHTEESKKLIGEKSKGRECKPETRKKLSDKLKGKNKPPRTEEHKQHLSESHKGKQTWNAGLTKETDERIAAMSKPLTEEHKQKIGLSNKGKKYPQVAQLKSIPVVQCDLDGKFLSFWSSAKEAAESFNYDRSKIAACCKGKCSSANNYKWFYLTEYLN